MLGLSCGTQDLLVAACGLISCSMQTLSCSMRDLVPRPGIEPRPPALEVRSLTHWTTREVPFFFFLKKKGRKEAVEFLATCFLK